jgi:P27 family predicted phage terminase small subunit
VPTPPVLLKETGNREWGRLWREVPWLSPISDLQMVSRLCGLYDRHATLVARVEADGVVVPGYRRQPRPHPLLATLGALEGEIRREAQCGLTPAARTVLGGIEVRRTSKLDDMIARHHAIREGR